MNIISSMAKRQVLGRLLLNVHKMIKMPIRNANDEERITMHLKIQDELRRELRIHIHPTVLIGAKKIKI